MLENTELKTN